MFRFSNFASFLVENAKQYMANFRYVLQQNIQIRKQTYVCVAKQFKEIIVGKFTRYIYLRYMKMFLGKKSCDFDEIQHRRSALIAFNIDIFNNVLTCLKRCIQS